MARELTWPWSTHLDLVNGGQIKSLSTTGSGRAEGDHHLTPSPFGWTAEVWWTSLPQSRYPDLDLNRQ